jgi:hypothetical protein
MQQSPSNECICTSFIRQNPHKPFMSDWAPMGMAALRVAAGDACARKGRSIAGADTGGLGQEGQLAVVQMHDSMIEMKAIRISSASVG